MIRFVFFFILIILIQSYHIGYESIIEYFDENQTSLSQRRIAIEKTYNTEKQSFTEKNERQSIILGQVNSKKTDFRSISFTTEEEENLVRNEGEEYLAQPTDGVTEEKEYLVQPTDDVTKGEENLAQPTDDVTKGEEYLVQLTDYVTEGEKYVAQLTDDLTLDTLQGNQPQRIFLELWLGYGTQESLGVIPGYGNAGGLLAFPLTETRVLFAEGNVYVLEHDEWAGRIGGGYRASSLNCFTSIGLNALYEYRIGQIGTYHEVTVGFEASIGSFFLRANGNIPTGKYVQKLDPVVFDNFWSSAFIATCTEVEFAHPGFNIDIGANLLAFQSNTEIRPSAGVYYFEGYCQDFWGVRLTTQITHRDTIGVHLEYTNDDSFRDTFYAYFFMKFQLSSFIPSRCKNLTRPTESFRIMPINHTCDWTWNW